MLHTDKTFREGFPLSHSANILSIKIVASEYGYPLNVYGTVIARDDLDRRSVYLFQRGEDNHQRITSEASNLECGVETATLVSMHSTLEMNFAFVRDAVEALSRSGSLRGLLISMVRSLLPLAEFPVKLCYMIAE
ncbi:hypothetical protein ZWY2020_008523 [Hordeum vulgare]|nr:hypothetical protein ZWY2020_008523 [Hordeum vulgare]